MKFKKLSVILIVFTVVTVAATSRFADTVQLFDQVALMFGGANRTETGDFYISYDEATDNRLEITDGTNLLGHVTDTGTTANYDTNGGDLTVDDLTADDLTVDDLAMDSLTLTTPLPVTSGGTGAASPDDILGTANQITVTAGADTIIGGNATLSLPDPTTMPGAFNVTGNTTLTGDIAVNGDDITSDGSMNITSSGTTITLTNSDLDTIIMTGQGVTFENVGSDSYIVSKGDGYRGILRSLGYRVSTARSEIQLLSADGTESAPTDVIASSGPQGRIRAQHYGGGNFRDSAYIDFYTDAGTISATSMPGEIRFLTAPDGSATPALAITINSDKTMVGTANWTTTGDIAANGDDFTSDGNMTVSANSGTGTVTIDDDLIVADDVTINGDTLDVGTASTLAITGADVTVAGFVTASTIVSNDGLLGTNLTYKFIQLGDNAGDDLTVTNDGDVGVYLDQDDSGTNQFEVFDGDDTIMVRALEGNGTNSNDISAYGRFMPDKLNLSNTSKAIPSATTIASGVVTIVNGAGLIVLDDEAPGPGDTLDKITLTGFTAATGDILIVMTDGDDIVITDDSGPGATDSINTTGAFTLTSTLDSLILMRVGTVWVEIGRNDVST